MAKKLGEMENIKDSDKLVKVPSILIVDDEEEIGYFLSNNLKRKGYKAHYTTNLENAKKAIDSAKPHILLLDNHLTDGLGIDFAKNILDEHPSIYVIMITAHDSIEDRRKALAHGVKHFLKKPFSIKEITDLVDNVANIIV